MGAQMVKRPSARASHGLGPSSRVLEGPSLNEKNGEGLFLTAQTGFVIGMTAVGRGGGNQLLTEELFCHGT